MEYLLGFAPEKVFWRNCRQMNDLELLQADGSVACLLDFLYDPIDELVNQEEGSE